MEIINIRKKYNLSQEKMADIIWITRQTYITRERSNKFKMEDIEKVNNYLFNLWIHLNQEQLLFNTIKHFPDLSIRQIEEFLEYLQDLKLLNEEWAKLKNTFWEFIYKK